MNHEAHHLDVAGDRTLLARLGQLSHAVFLCSLITVFDICNYHTTLRRLTG